MAFICACCFSATEDDKAKCTRCSATKCTDCDGKNALLTVQKDPDAPPPDTEDYSEFLNRFEDQLLPAVQKHFENPTRGKMKARLHICRAMILAEAMLNYRVQEYGQSGLSAELVRYAVALRSFGKLKQDPAEPHVVHLHDSREPSEEPVHVARLGWARRSAGFAKAYLGLLGVPDDQVKQIAGMLRQAPEGGEAEIVRDAFILDRLHKLAKDEQAHSSPQAFLQAAEPILKGHFQFGLEPEHKQAREVLLCEAGLLMKMTEWQDEEHWKSQGYGALARIERVLRDYADFFPFLHEFYFEEPTHSISVG